MERSKFADILTVDDEVIIEVLENEDRITAPFSVAEIQVENINSQWWQNVKAKWVAEGRFL